MNQWLEFVSKSAEQYFGFLRDEFGFTIEIPKHASTETVVNVSKHQANVDLLIFMMPIQGSSPWILIRSTARGKVRSVNLDDLIRIRCPQFSLSAREEHEEASVWQRYSFVLRTQFEDLLCGAVTLDEVATDSI
jgi:hypothetical protein